MHRTPYTVHTLFTYNSFICIQWNGEMSKIKYLESTEINSDKQLAEMIQRGNESDLANEN